MPLATVSQHDPSPDPEQAIDGGGGIGERDAPVAEDGDPGAGLEIDGPEAVVDQRPEGVLGVCRRRFVEIEDDASTGGSGETERGDVVQDGVTRPDGKHPMDEVSFCHVPERTKLDEA